MKVKKLILANIPVSKCNFKCSYCYLTHRPDYEKKDLELKHSPQFIRKALSIERMGGPCYVNLCGDGETLLPAEVVEITRELLEEGHFIDITTNGVLTPRFKALGAFPRSLLERLSIKFSFHYEELLRTGTMKAFFDNVHLMYDAGASFTVELPPDDGIADMAEEIKQVCLDNIGAICQVTINRADDDVRTPILTDMSDEDYRNAWKQYNSPMWDFKMTTYYVKRTEFCYAGAWSFFLDISTGEASQCYHSNYYENIYDDIAKPIGHFAIGNNCMEAHCYNAHLLLTFGLIPEMQTPPYAAIRNRVCTDGSEWLQGEVKPFFSSKLIESNRPFTEKEKRKINRRNRWYARARKSRVVRFFVKKIYET